MYRFKAEATLRGCKAKVSLEYSLAYVCYLLSSSSKSSVLCGVNVLPWSKMTETKKFTFVNGHSLLEPLCGV